MRGVIAITDLDWFTFLSARHERDEVNFWRPSDLRRPQLTPGTPLIFKLKQRHGGHIVGYGIFARHVLQRAWLVWESFGERNGAGSFAEMRARVERLRHDATPDAHARGDYVMGCLLLVQPVFLSREDWVRPPADWPAHTVQGKSYDLTTGEGARIWSACLAGTTTLPAAAPVVLGGPLPRYGEPALVRPRLGQGSFRLAVTDAYESACAVTDEHSLPALDAAHIRAYEAEGPHDVPNGVLLRSDLHRLFDRGYVGITPEHRFVVSPRLRADFSNGRSYYPLDGKPVRMPASPSERPHAEFLRWHLEHRFRD
jgi:putative restriction endonuclease